MFHPLPVLLNLTPVQVARERSVHGTVAQVEEQRAVNPLVGGSSPSRLAMEPKRK